MEYTGAYKKSKAHPQQTKCLTCPHHTKLCDQRLIEEIKNNNCQGRFKIHSLCWCCANADSGLKCNYIRTGKPIEGWVATSRKIDSDLAYNVSYCPNFKRTEDDTNEY